MTVTDSPTATPDDAHDAGAHEHPPDSLYIKVAIILALLTAAEVATYFVDLGDWLLPVLLVMMVVKFALVAMFFMHLRFDDSVLGWVFIAGLALAVGVYVIALSAFEQFA